MRLAEHMDTLELMMNAESKFAPILKANYDATQAIFWSFDNGVDFAYDNVPELKIGNYFDIRQSGWYILAQETQSIGFTDVYLDNFGKGLTITCSAPLYDENDIMCGAIGFDILVGDLYNSIIDLNLGEGAFAFVSDCSLQYGSAYLHFLP